MGRAAFLALLLAGCGVVGGGFPSGSSDGVPRPVRLAVLHRDCVGGTADHLPGADAVSVRVTGPGLAGLGVDLAYDGSGALVVPDVPSGKDRVFEVDVTKGGVRLGWGVSAATSIPAEGEARAALLAYPVNDSVRAGTLEGGCAAMATGRGGFSIARLNDGRVLVAGGYTSGGPGGLTGTAEIVDPRTGDVTPAAACEDASCARAYGPAVVVPDGRVLIAGGLVLPDGRPESAHALLYDPATDSWRTLEMGQARRFATATALGNVPGEVLVIGGVGDRAGDGSGVSGGILDTTEIFDARTDTFTPGDRLDQPVARHGAVQFTSRSAVGIAGGITVNDAGLPTVSGLVEALDSTTGKRLSASELTPAVALPLVVRLGDLLLVLGGATGWQPAAEALADGEPEFASMFEGAQLWSGSGKPSRLQGGAGVAAGCGVTLDKTSTWTGGGLNQASSPVSAMQLAVVIPEPALTDVERPDAPGVAQTLEDRRADFGCVKINDHQILIAGGWGNSRGGANRALDSLEIFTY